MSNRRRVEREAAEALKLSALVSGLKLLASTGCGESSTEIDGVWVDVIVGCRDSGCLQCGAAIGANPPARPLAAEDGSHDSGCSEAVWFPRRSIR